jgi:nitrogen PTS system EIIA component
MRMTDFVVRQAVLPDLEASTKEGVVREMVESLHAAGALRSSELDDIIGAILERERISSTGIGRGIAIPHAKHGGVDRLIGTVAVSKKGIAFDSLDKQPVHVCVLLISPRDRARDHLRALENVARCLRDDGFVRLLREVPTREALVQLLDRLDLQTS